MTGPPKLLPRPHRYDPEPKTWLCKECPLLPGHEVHSEAAIEAAEPDAESVAEQQKSDARRLGERPDED